MSGAISDTLHCSKDDQLEARAERRAGYNRKSSENGMNVAELPLWSIFLLAVAALAILYMARPLVHRIVGTLARMIVALLRQNARALLALAADLKARNRDVLLELGQSRLERRLERDFHRMKAFVERDLAHFPDLQHTIDRHIQKLEEDYHRTAETPPPAPDWLDAIEAVVKLRETQSGNPVVANVLKDLETNLHKQHRQSLADYRKGMTHRHRLLHGMMPQWRKLNHALQRVGQGIRSLSVLADEVDKHMRQYREVQSGSQRAESALRVSTLTHFLFSSLALAAWLAIAWLGFEWVRQPLAESMAGATGIGGFALADITAATLVVLEIAIGLVLLEVLQITRFFEGFVTLDSGRRKIVFWSALLVLTLLALSQSGLIYLRDAVNPGTTPLDRLIAYPVIIVEAPLLDEWLVIGARMMLAFILPFALVFLAVPLERWLETIRVLAAVAVIQLLHLGSLALRLMATTARYIAQLALALYDLIIAVPLWLEARWVTRAQPRTRVEAAPQPESPITQLNTKGEMSVNSQ